MSDAKNMRQYLNLFEAAVEYTGPKASDTVTYSAETTKGELTKITAFLASYDSARYTKLGNNLVKIVKLTEELKQLQDETKEEARELLGDFFWAENAFAPEWLRRSLSPSLLARLQSQWLRCLTRRFWLILKSI